MYVQQRHSLSLRMHAVWLAVHLKKFWVLSYPQSAEGKLQPECVDA